LLRNSTRFVAIRVADAGASLAILPGIMSTPRARKSTVSRQRPRVTAMDQAPPPPSYDDVARRAYELFLERGGTHGQDRNDWLSAERQLLSTKP